MKEKSKFVKVKCKECKNEQITYEKATTEVKCLNCNSILSSPSGGKAKIKARVEELLM